MCGTLYITPFSKAVAAGTCMACCCDFRVSNGMGSFGIGCEIRVGIVSHGFTFFNGFDCFKPPFNAYRHTPRMFEFLLSYLVFMSVFLLSSFYLQLVSGMNEVINGLPLSYSIFETVNFAVKKKSTAEIFLKGVLLQSIKFKIVATHLSHFFICCRLQGNSFQPTKRLLWALWMKLLNQKRYIMLL